MALLELRQVEAAYGPVKALHGIDAEVPDGSIVALLGANGAGKTTTLRAITGMVRARGQIRFAGRDVLNQRPEEVTRLGVAHVPEGRGTLSQLTVWENLQMGAYIRRDRKGVKRDLERVCGYFPWMEQRRRQVAALLSGGEQHMLAIGRALMLRPRLLLLDEPSLGLAPMVVEELHRRLKEIHARGTAILLVEQNSALALSLATRGIVLESGRIALAGSADTLRNDPRVR